MAILLESGLHVLIGGRPYQHGKPARHKTQGEAWDICKLISFSCAKLVLLEVVLQPKKMARNKERTHIQKKKAVDAVAFSSWDHEE